MKSISIQIHKHMFGGFSASLVHPAYKEMFTVDADDFKALEAQISLQLLLFVVSDLKKFVIVEQKRLGLSLVGKRKAKMDCFSKAVKQFSRNLNQEGLMDLADEIYPFMEDLLPSKSSRLYTSQTFKLEWFKLICDFDVNEFLKPYKSKYYKEIEAL